jgi:hypothetical protein
VLLREVQRLFRLTANDGFDQVRYGKKAQLQCRRRRRRPHLNKESRLAKQDSIRSAEASKNAIDWRETARHCGNKASDLREDCNQARLTKAS